MELGLKRRSALICGSTQGLGLEIARTIAEEGAQVVICGRQSERVDAAVALIIASGGEAVGVAADLMTAQGRQSAVETGRSAFGKIDIAVLNGGGPPPGRFADFSLQQWSDAYRQLVESAVHLSSLVLPGMQARRWGRLLAITSFATRQPADQLIISNSLRASVNGLMRSIANEYGPDGITANSILPGFIRTERMECISAAQAAQANQTMEEGISERCRGIPLRRLGKPREFANVATFLVSEAAAYVTGAAITVDGGMVGTVF